MFRLFLLAGILPLSRLHALLPPGAAALVVSLCVVGLFWTFIVRQLILPLIFGRDVVLRDVNPRLLLLFTAFFLLQFGSAVHAYLNSVVDLLFVVRTIAWWLTVYLFSLAVFLTPDPRVSFAATRNALLAGPVLYTVLNAGLYLAGFERLEVAENFRWEIQNIMLRLAGIESVVPFYPLSSAPRSLAIVAASSTLICLYAGRRLQALTLKLACFAAAAASFVIVLTTDSRMAVAALFAAIAGYGLLRLSRSVRLLRLAPAVAPLFPFIILQVAVLVALLDVSGALSRQRFDNISTLSGRSDLWEFVFEEIAHPKPIHLVGYGQYGQVTAGVGEKYAYIFSAQNGDITRKTAHNMVLQTFLDVGYIGVAIFLLMLYEVIRIATDSRTPHRDLYCRLLILVFVFGITSSTPTLMSIEMSTFFFLFVGMFASLRAQDYDPEAHAEPAALPAAAA